MVPMPEKDSAPVLDDETTAALTLYNEYVDADRERTRREKRVKKAERAKEDAAAEVKKVSGSGSAEQKAAAEQAYREANETWRKLRDGEEPEAPAATPKPEAEPEAPEAEATAEPVATEPEPEATEPEAETTEASAEPEAAEATAPDSDEEE